MKMKKWITVILCIITVLMIIPTTAMAESKDDWDGYIPISTKEELNNIRMNLNGKYYLTNDIVFNPEDFEEGGAFYNEGEGWIPIGNVYSADSKSYQCETFYGILNGNGYCISGLKINSSKSIYVGLFGENAGTICNLGLSYSKIVANSETSVYSGGIAAVNYGLIRSCYNCASVDGFAKSAAKVGGITGYNVGSVNLCYNTGNIYAYISSSGHYAGGIVGHNSGTISTSYNIGNVMAGEYDIEWGNGYCGEISYRQGEFIKNCYYLVSEDKAIVETYGTGLTTNEFCNESNFIGFDFEKDWCFMEVNGYPFPQLRGALHSEVNNTSDFANGSGTIYNPYVIVTTEHLNNVRYYLGGYYVLDDNINFEACRDIFNDGMGWLPVGDTRKSPFRGYFDGNGYSIDGIYIYQEGPYIGLLGYNKGVVKNLSINGEITVNSSSGNTYVGSIAGWNDGKGSGRGNLRNSGIIKNCVSKCDIFVTNTSQQWENVATGGIAGVNLGEIVSSGYVASDLITNTYGHVGNSSGGIVGSNRDFDFFIGGTISHCYNQSTITATSESAGACAGGISGTSSSYIKNSYNAGNINVSSVSGSAFGGGISASGGVIINCYNLGSICGTVHSKWGEAFLAGITVNPSGTVSNVYNVGSVKNAGESTGSVGAIIYDDIDITGGSTVNNAFFLDTLGIGEENTDAKALTQAEMKDKNSFIGYDFSDVWFFAPASGYEYPQIKGNAYMREIPIVSTPEVNAEYGQTLEELNVQLMTKEGDISGSWRWVDAESIKLDLIGNVIYKAIFIPADLDRYKTLEQNITIVVSRKIVTNPTIIISPENYWYTGFEIIAEEVIVKDGDLIIPSSEYRLIYSDNVYPGNGVIKIEAKEDGNYAFTGITEKKYQIKELLLGDVNCDGDINAIDLTTLARHVAKIEELTDSHGLLASDVTDDGEIDASDLTKLSRFVAKIISSLE